MSEKERTRAAPEANRKGQAAPTWEGATLRDALRDHRAGPELLAVLDDLADRPLPAGWRRWDEERWDVYLDAVLAEARARHARAHSGRGARYTDPEVGSSFPTR
jgi:hypothetical protein